MSNAYQIVMPFDFEDEGLKGLKECLKDLSKNEIDFYDERWVCDRLAKNVTVDAPERYTIYYSNVPEKYKDWIRYYALAMYTWKSSNDAKHLKQFLS